MPPLSRRVVERVLVDLLGDGVVDDVARLDALVVGLEPGVDPERLDADDLLLLVGHRARDVHHVDDDGDALRLLARPSTTRYCLSSRIGTTSGSSRVVGAGGDLPLQGPLEGALEVAQRLRAGLADAGVLVLGRDDVLLAPRLDARQFQFLAEDLRPVSSSDSSTSRMWPPGWSPAPGLAVALRRGRAAGRLRRRPGRRRRSPCCRSGNAACRSAAAEC